MLEKPDQKPPRKPATKDSHGINRLFRSYPLNKRTPRPLDRPPRFDSMFDERS